MGILKSLSVAGAVTVMHGLLDPMELREKATDLSEQTGSTISTSAADLQDPKQIRKMVNDVVEEHGRLDILVNNAGIQHVAPVAEFPEDMWDRIISRFSLASLVESLLFDLSVLFWRVLVVSWFVVSETIYLVGIAMFFPLFLLSSL